ncbi:MAG: nucleotidyltransferase domain-containing protein, partial [Elusimicrobia bacterium]|nr:nucleotidyltransferase domain-containing protein [Elusimicrobiota bacterium]
WASTTARGRLMEQNTPLARIVSMETLGRELTLYPIGTTLVLTMDYNTSETFGLFKSKARRALLALFFTNPDQEYFPRQLERLSGVFVGNLQRELIPMEQAGLLKARRLGKLKLYRLNRQHPLYPELSSLVAKTAGLEEMLRSRLAAVEGIQAACIYGSFAAKQARSRSDVDVLILGQVDEKALIGAVRSLEKVLQREINYTLYTPDQWRKRKAAKDSFVLEVLKRPRIHLIGGPDGIQ